MLASKRHKRFRPGSPMPLSYTAAWATIRATPSWCGQRNLLLSGGTISEPHPARHEARKPNRQAYDNQRAKGELATALVKAAKQRTRRARQQQHPHDTAVHENRAGLVDAQV